MMENIIRLFLISFLFYIIGHIFWSLEMMYDTPFFLEKESLGWQLLINIPFGLFAIFGLIASIRWYQIVRRST